MDARCAIEITALYKLVSALGKFSAFVFVSQPIAINNAQIESWPPPAPQITHNRTENLAQANRVFAPLRFRTVSPPTEREATRNTLTSQLDNVFLLHQF
jgi:hypothetical protein